VWQGISANLAQRDAGDLDDVGAEDRADCKRDDGVEGDGAAQVDEGKKAGDDEGDADGVEGDVPARSDAKDNS